MLFSGFGYYLFNKKVIKFILSVLAFFSWGIHGSSADSLWKTYEYKQYRFSIESPYPLTKTDHPLTPAPPGKHALLRRMSADTAQAGKAFRVKVDCSEYKNYTPTLKTIKDYLAAESKKDKVDLNLSDVHCSGVPAILAKGDNWLLHTRTLVMVKGRLFWIVKIEYAENGPGLASDMADRIIESIHLGGLK